MDKVNSVSGDPYVISNVPSLEGPIFNPLDFPPLARIFSDLPSIQISSSPVEDCSSLLLIGSKAGVKPLETYSTIPEGSDTVAISSIRRPNVYVRKPKKRVKDKSKEELLGEGEGLDSLCQNDKVSSQFYKHISRDSGLSSVVYDRPLRESTTPKIV